MEDDPDLLLTFQVFRFRALATTPSLRAGNQTQGLTHTRQALYHLSYIPNPNSYFLSKGLCIFILH